jgi:deoxyadenosine/deoxycytidine kinase
MDDDDFFKTYQPHFKILTDILTPPDLMLYLRASLDTLMYRIDKRSRDMEATIPRSYMEMLQNAYEEWIAEYPHRKLIVETDDLDLTCDLNCDWMDLFGAIHNKLLNNELPDEAVSLNWLKREFPQIRKSNGNINGNGKILTTV